MRFVKVGDINVNIDELVLDNSGHLQKSSCAYFKEKFSISHVIHFNDKEKISPELFEKYLEKGYRRFGRVLYKNICPHCRMCVPIRIRVGNFKLSGSQKRVLKKNRKTNMEIKPHEFCADNFYLFNNYRGNKHNSEFLSEFEFKIYYCESIIDTYDFNYKIDDNVIGIGIVDKGKSSISTVYFYFDVNYGKFSPGTYSIIKEIEYCQKNGIEYYYLGYYLKSHSTMDYKANFKPHQLYLNNEWVYNEN